MWSNFFLVIGVHLRLTVLALVAYSIFELSPCAHHKDHYRDDVPAPAASRARVSTS